MKAGRGYGRVIHDGPATAAYTALLFLHVRRRFRASRNAQTFIQVLTGPRELSATSLALL